MRKYIYFLFCFITFSNTAFAQKSPDKNTNSASNKTLISRNLKLSVDKDSGNFIFYAKEKQDSAAENNSKDWGKLLSEKTIPSSYFLFLKNGASIGYGSGEKGIHTCQIKWNEIKYAWENAEVRIISSFCFSENRATSSYDGFKIKLNIQNISKNEIAAHLADKNLYTITVLKEIDSTNTYLKSTAEKGEKDGSVVIAETQTAGRGRLGRHFYSDKGGLYMSILIRPDMPTERSLFITTGAAVAVSRAIEKVCGKKVGIKWVNDIFIDGKKVCGILTEGASDFETGRLQYAVVGIGINVTEPQGKFNAEIADIATAIYEKDVPWGIKNRLAAEVLNQFSEIMKAPDDKMVIDEYRSRSILINKEVYIIEKHKDDFQLK